MTKRRENLYYLCSTVVFLLLLFPLTAPAKCISTPIEHNSFSHQEIRGDTLNVYFQRSIDGIPFKRGGVSFQTINGVEGRKNIEQNYALVFWNFKLDDEYKSINVHASYDDQACSSIDVAQYYQDEIASLGLKKIFIYWHE